MILKMARYFSCYKMICSLIFSTRTLCRKNLTGSRADILKKNCILAKSHHVDLAGEPYFLEGMQVKYHQKAAEAGVYIVGACGFDSIPADLGIVHMQKTCANEISWIDTFAKMEPGAPRAVLTMKGRENEISQNLGYK